MADIKDSLLRTGAKTTKLVAPALPASIDPKFDPKVDAKVDAKVAPAGPAAKAFSVRDALRTVTRPRNKLVEASQTRVPSPVEVGTALASAAKAGILFGPLPGALMLAKSGLATRAIPAVMLRQPVALRAILEFAFQGYLMAFVAGFKEAYDKLSPEQKAQYDSVAKTLGNDPAGKRALAVLLVNGALAAKDLKGDGTLLDHLDTIATGPLADGIDRKQLLSNVVGDIANSGNISQGTYNTCGAATAQRLLAGQSPAEYARIMAGLTSPSGEVKLANGDTLKRAPDWDKSRDDGRDLAGRLFQASVMAYAAAKGGESYSNATDERTKKNGVKKQGLNAAEVVYMFEGLLGKDYEKYAVSDIGADALMQKIKSVVAKGGVVPCAITVDGSRHEVLVTKVENGQVSYYDPRSGQTKVMAEAEFKAMLFNANVPNPVVLAFRLGAFKNFAKFARGSAFDEFAPGGPRGSLKAASAARDDAAPASEGDSGGKGGKAGKGFFGFPALSDLVKLLVLMGAADEEIGDGSGSGSQTGSDKRAGSSSSTKSSTSDRKGRGGGRTGKTSGG